MKYGESTFDILYLLFAIISGFLLLKNSKSKIETYMGYATLILGIGDSFHLVPRVLNYFLSNNFTVALGVGKFITSITMTIFYIFVYYIWVLNYHKDEKPYEKLIWVLAIIRCVLCLFPQNGWFTNESGVTWGIIRNVPFVLLGGIICYMYYQMRKEDLTFKNLWLYILFSFLFYMPVAIGASIVPILGMLMLPKTVCYILMIIDFLKKQKELSV